MKRELQLPITMQIHQPGLSGQRLGTKRKGRPLEPPTGDPGVDQKRTRTRQVTRAFRSRTANYVQELQKRVETLQDVVEGLSETFVGVNDALVRSGYLSRDRELASELRKGMENFLALSKIAQQETDGGLEETGELEVEEPLPILLASSTRSISERRSDTRRRSSGHSLMTQGPTHQDVSLLGAKQKAHAGWFTPQLSYNVWSDPPSQWPSSRATNNVLHYITAGHDSFAARLYWNSLTLAFRSLRGDEDSPVDFVKSMFRFKLRYSTPERVLTVIGHVLNQMLLGTSNFDFDESRTRNTFVDRKILPEPNETGAIDTNAVKNAIYRDIIQDGGLVDEYLDTWAVERHIADQWAVLVNSSTARLLHRNIVMDIDPLIERLTTVAVTIGEGPRYPRRDVDMAILSFLTETHSIPGTA